MLGRVIVVPLASPETAAWLGRLAARLAAPDDGLVVPVSVVPPNADEARLEQAEIAIARAEDAARAGGAHARGRVVRDESVTEAVLDAMAADDATLALMGWQGHSSSHNVFGELIDSIVGQSLVPLAIVRPADTEFDRILVPLSQDHLLPAGKRGVTLAASIADRLRVATGAGVLLLRTGNPEEALPKEIHELSAMVHHDPRPVDVAVGDAARESDIVVTPVAPTLEGLRAATTHMAWATPGSWLLVAIDVGPPPDVDVAAAVKEAGMTAPPRPALEEDRPHRIVVTVRPALGVDLLWDRIDEALRLVGPVSSHKRWQDEEGRDCHRGEVEVIAPASGVALAATMMALDEAREYLGPSEITYAVAGDV